MESTEGGRVAIGEAPPFAKHKYRYKHVIYTLKFGNITKSIWEKISSWGELVEELVAVPCGPHLLSPSPHFTGGYKVGWSDFLERKNEEPCHVVPKCYFEMLLLTWLH